MVCIFSNRFWIVASLCCNDLSVASLRISEFLASNDQGLQDFEGDYEDWIEVHNDGSNDINLESYTLTDSESNLGKWTFPSITIAADEYLIVFASDKADDETGAELHANFKLSASGEYLAMIDPNGVVLTEFSPEYPAQTSDQSFGLNEAGDTVFFPTPTPGSVNDGLSKAPTVNFSVPRGFYTDSFMLSLTQASGNTELRYTLDGSTPTSSTGTVYQGPIEIAETTVVRAASFGINYVPEENVETHTFIFLQQVIQQPAEIPGFPNGRRVEVRHGSKETVPLDFEMDPAVVSEYSNEIMEAMQSIPSLALTASPEEIFGEDGFY